MNDREAPPPAWQPAPVPVRGENAPATLNAFHAYILTPGFSLAFHAATLNRSLTSIATFRAKATKAVHADPAIMEMVRALVRAITAEEGLRMALLRGAAQLPYWSRRAVLDYRKRGLSRRELAAAFRCSPGTIANVLQGKGQGYRPFSGERRLTDAQAAPAGRWSSSKAREAPPCDQHGRQELAHLLTKLHVGSRILQ